MNKLYTLALFLFIALLSFQLSQAGMVGGWNGADPKDPELVDLFHNEVAGQFVTSLNAPNINTRPVIQKISTQVVAGLNIRYVVLFDHEQYELTVFRDLKNNVSLTKVVKF